MRFLPKHVAPGFALAAPHLVGRSTRPKRGPQALLENRTCLVLEALYVALDNRGGPLAVAVSQRLEHLTVLVETRVQFGQIPYILVPQPLGLGVKHLKGLREEAVVGGVPDLFVADSVGVEQVGPVGLLHLRGGPQGVVHRLPVLLRPAYRGQPMHVGLKHRAGLVEQRQIAHVDGGYEYAATRDDRDELIALQALQGLTNRCAADADSLLQFLLVHGRAGLQLKADDEPFDCFVGGVRK